MKTILRINHMDILLPEGANVTQLLKTFSKSKEVRNNYAITSEREKWEVKPITELRVLMVEDSKVVQEKVKPS